MVLFGDWSRLRRTWLRCVSEAEGERMCVERIEERWEWTQLILTIRMVEITCSYV